MNDLFSLSGKFILVTGGTRGIGGAMSLRFIQAGASVLANYVRNHEAAQKLEQEVSRQGNNIEICRADLTMKKGLDKLVEVIAAKNSKLSALVHCAATGVYQPFEELSTRQFDWTFALNVRAFFDLVNRLLPMFDAGSSLVAISSQGAVQAVPYYSIVGASKGALESLVRHMAAELGPKGIRVNCLSPGTVLTDAWDSMPNKDERIAQTIEHTPTRRLVTPDEVAWTAQFLCSDASKGINGHTLVVDGGARIVA